MDQTVKFTSLHYILDFLTRVLFLHSSPSTGHYALFFRELKYLFFRDLLLFF